MKTFSSNKLLIATGEYDFRLIKNKELNQKNEAVSTIENLAEIAFSGAPVLNREGQVIGVFVKYDIPLAPYTGIMINSSFIANDVQTNFNSQTYSYVLRRLTQVSSNSKVCCFHSELNNQENPDPLTKLVCEHYVCRS